MKTKEMVLLRYAAISSCKNIIITDLDIYIQRWGSSVTYHSQFHYSTRWNARIHCYLTVAGCSSQQEIYESVPYSQVFDVTWLNRYSRIFPTQNWKYWHKIQKHQTKTQRMQGFIHHPTDNWSNMVLKYKQCILSINTVLYLQTQHCIYKHGTVPTNMVLYLQTWYCIYKHHIVPTSNVFYL